MKEITGHDLKQMKKILQYLRLDRAMLHEEAKNSDNGLGTADIEVSDKLQDMIQFLESYL